MLSTTEHFMGCVVESPSVDVIKNRTVVSISGYFMTVGFGKAPKLKLKCVGAANGFMKCLVAGP